MTSKCGEILVGVTTEKHKLEVAGVTLRDFSLGKVQTEITAEFQRIASEVSINGESRVKIACKAMELSGENLVMRGSVLYVTARLLIE